MKKKWPYLDCISLITLFFFLLSPDEIQTGLWFITFMIVYPVLAHRFYLKPTSHWLITCLLAGSAIFFMGTILLHSAYGYQPLTMTLNIDGNPMNRYADTGNVSCEGQTALILEGEDIACSIAPPTRVNKSKITFISITGKRNETSAWPVISIPANTTAIIFEFEAIKDNGEIVHISTSDYYRVFSLDEHTERNQTFVNYFLGMIGVLLFSLPTFFANMRNLAK